jgi:hypothetical protein
MVNFSRLLIVFAWRDTILYPGPAPRPPRHDIKSGVPSALQAFPAMRPECNTFASFAFKAAKMQYMCCFSMPCGQNAIHSVFFQAMLSECNTLFVFSCSAARMQYIHGFCVQCCQHAIDFCGLPAHNFVSCRPQAPVFPPRYKIACGSKTGN